MDGVGLPQVGAVAVLVGYEKFLAQLRNTERAYDKAFGSVGATASTTAGVLGDLGTVAGGAALLGVTALGGGLLLLAGRGLRAAVDAAGEFLSSLRQIAAEGMRTAGRYQELELAALATGRAMGLQEQQVRQAIETIHDLNIRYDAAASAVAQFARNQIDLSTATELVRIAQGAAVLMGEDSSETLERLTWAVTTHNTLMLRSMGINVDLTAAEERHAAALGRTREQLTEVELAQADVNAVLKAGANLADVYAASLESPTKALRSLTDRVIPELQAAAMQALLPAWATLVNATMDLGDALRKALQEGGALYPVIVRIGAYASIMADAFASGVEAIVRAVTGMRGEVTEGLVQLVDDAARWGVGIAAALAEGIVSGATWAIAAAMDAVGWLLASFLAPGSPPKVAPGLPAWGAAAMADYLRGFAEADFTVLEKLQAPLRAVLGGPRFAQISREIAGAIAGGMTPAFFDRLAEAAGHLGGEIAELARREWAYAQALDAVEQASGRHERAQRRVSDLIGEYNRMLRAGAGQEALKAKLAEINAAEAEKQAAATERQNAAASLEDLKARAALQEKLVGQLVDLARAQQQAAAAAAGAPGAAAGMPPMAAAPLAGVWDIVSRIDEAVKAAKAAIAERFPELLAPLRTAWDSIQAQLFGVEAGWVFDWETMRPRWEAGEEGLLDRWSRFWGEDMVGPFEGFREFLDAFVADPLGTLGGVVGGAIKRSWEETGRAEVEGVGRNLLTVLFPWTIGMQKGLAFGENIISWLIAGFWKRREAAVAGLKYVTVNALIGLVALYDRFVDTAKLLVQGIIDGIIAMRDAVRTAAGNIADWIVGVIRDLLGIRSESRVGFEIGRSLGRGVVSGFDDALGRGAPLAAAMADAMGAFGGGAVTRSPVGAVQNVQHVVTIAPQATFGPVSMATPMDQAAFFAMADRWFARVG